MTSSCSSRFAGVLAAVFFFNQCLFAQEAEKSLWESRRRVARDYARLGAPPVVPPLPSVGAVFSEGVPPPGPIPFGEGRTALSPTQSKSTPFTTLLRALPPSAVTVRKIVVPADGEVDRVVLFLQDVHLNQEAQGNIAQTVRALIEKGEVGVVGLEGSKGPLPLARFRGVEVRGAVREATEVLFQEKVLSGAMAAGLLSEGPTPVLVGVDSPRGYVANVRAYRESLRRKEAYENRWNVLTETIAQTKGQVLNPRLKVFDGRVTSYRRGETGLGAYVEALASEGALKDYPNVRGFHEALVLERTLDFKSVEAERSTVVSTLVGRMTALERGDFLREGLAHRRGEIRTGTFYGRFKTRCRQAGVDLRSYSSLAKYLDYVLLADGVDAEKLGVELESLEDERCRALIQTEEEKELIRRAKGLFWAGRLLAFGMTKNEWTNYKTKGDPGILGGDCPLAVYERFYREAEKRDAALAENILTAMGTQKTGVLVAGGFHTEGVGEVLRAKGVTVVTVAPQLRRGEEQRGSPELNVFAREKLPVEKIFEGEKLFLTPVRWTAATTARLALLASAGTVARGKGQSVQQGMRWLLPEWAKRFRSVEGRWGRTRWVWMENPRRGRAGVFRVSWDNTGRVTSETWIDVPSPSRWAKAAQSGISALFQKSKTGIFLVLGAYPFLMKRLGLKNSANGFSIMPGESEPSLSRAPLKDLGDLIREQFEVFEKNWAPDLIERHSPVAPLSITPRIKNLWLMGVFLAKAVHEGREWNWASFLESPQPEGTFPIDRRAYMLEEIENLTRGGGWQTYGLLSPPSFVLSRRIQKGKLVDLDALLEGGKKTSASKAARVLESAPAFQSVFLDFIEQGKKTLAEAPARQWNFLIGQELKGIDSTEALELWILKIFHSNVRVSRYSEATFPKILSRVGADHFVRHLKYVWLTKSMEARFGSLTSWLICNTVFVFQLEEFLWRNYEVIRDNMGLEGLMMILIESAAHLRRAPLINHLNDFPGSYWKNGQLHLMGLIDAEIIFDALDRLLRHLFHPDFVIGDNAEAKVQSALASYAVANALDLSLYQGLGPLPLTERLISILLNSIPPNRLGHFFDDLIRFATPLRPVLQDDLSVPSPAHLTEEVGWEKKVNHWYESEFYNHPHLTKITYPLVRALLLWEPWIDSPLRTATLQERHQNYLDGLQNLKSQVLSQSLNNPWRQRKEEADQRLRGLLALFSFYGEPEVMSFLPKKDQPRELTERVKILWTVAALSAWKKQFGGEWDWTFFKGKTGQETDQRTYLLEEIKRLSLSQGWGWSVYGLPSPWRAAADPLLFEGSSWQEFLTKLGDLHFPSEKADLNQDQFLRGIDEGIKFLGATASRDWIEQFHQLSWTTDLAPFLEFLNRKMTLSNKVPNFPERWAGMETNPISREVAKNVFSTIRRFWDKKGFESHYGSVDFWLARETVFRLQSPYSLMRNVDLLLKDAGWMGLVPVLLQASSHLRFVNVEDHENFESGVFWVGTEPRSFSTVDVEILISALGLILNRWMLFKDEEPALGPFQIPLRTLVLYALGSALDPALYDDPWFHPEGSPRHRQKLILKLKTALPREELKTLFDELRRLGGKGKGSFHSYGLVPPPQLRSDIFSDEASLPGRVNHFFILKDLLEMANFDRMWWSPKKFKEILERYFSATSPPSVALSPVKKQSEVANPLLGPLNTFFFHPIKSPKYQKLFLENIRWFEKALAQKESAPLPKLPENRIEEGSSSAVDGVLLVVSVVGIGAGLLWGTTDWSLMESVTAALGLTVLSAGAHEGGHLLERWIKKSASGEPLLRWSRGGRLNVPGARGASGILSSALLSAGLLGWGFWDGWTPLLLAAIFSNVLLSLGPTDWKDLTRSHGRWKPRPLLWVLGAFSSLQKRMGLNLWLSQTAMGATDPKSLPLQEEQPETIGGAQFFHVRVDPLFAGFQEVWAPVGDVHVPHSETVLNPSRRILVLWRMGVHLAQVAREKIPWDWTKMKFRSEGEPYENIMDRNAFMLEEIESLSLNDGWRRYGLVSPWIFVRRHGHDPSVWANDALLLALKEDITTPASPAEELIDLETKEVFLHLLKDGKDVFAERSFSEKQSSLGPLGFFEGGIEDLEKRMTLAFSMRGTGSIAKYNDSYPVSQRVTEKLLEEVRSVSVKKFDLSPELFDLLALRAMVFPYQHEYSLRRNVQILNTRLGTLGRIVLLIGTAGHLSRFDLDLHNELSSASYLWAGIFHPKWRIDLDVLLETLTLFLREMYGSDSLGGNVGFPQGKAWTLWEGGLYALTAAVNPDLFQNAEPPSLIHRLQSIVLREVPQDKLDLFFKGIRSTLEAFQKGSTQVRLLISPVELTDNPFYNRGITAFLAADSNPSNGILSALLRDSENLEKPQAPHGMNSDPHQKNMKGLEDLERAVRGALSLREPLENLLQSFGRNWVPPVFDNKPAPGVHLSPTERVTLLWWAAALLAWGKRNTGRWYWDMFEDERRSDRDVFLLEEIYGLSSSGELSWRLYGFPNPWEMAEIWDFIPKEKNVFSFNVLPNPPKTSDPTGKGLTQNDFLSGVEQGIDRWARGPAEVLIRSFYQLPWEEDLSSFRTFLRSNFVLPEQHINDASISVSREVAKQFLRELRSFWWKTHLDHFYGPVDFWWFRETIRPLQSENTLRRNVYACREGAHHIAQLALLLDFSTHLRRVGLQKHANSFLGFDGVHGQLFRKSTVDVEILLELVRDLLHHLFSSPGVHLGKLTDDFPEDAAHLPLNDLTHYALVSALDLSIYDAYDKSQNKWVYGETFPNQLIQILREEIPEDRRAAFFRELAATKARIKKHGLLFPTQLPMELYFDQRSLPGQFNDMTVLKRPLDFANIPLGGAIPDAQMAAFGRYIDARSKHRPPFGLAPTPGIEKFRNPLLAPLYLRSGMESSFGGAIAERAFDAQLHRLKKKLGGELKTSGADVVVMVLSVLGVTLGLTFGATEWSFGESFLTALGLTGFAVLFHEAGHGLERLRHQTLTDLPWWRWESQGGAWGWGRLTVPHTGGASGVIVSTLLFSGFFLGALIGSAPWFWAALVPHALLALGPTDWRDILKGGRQGGDLLDARTLTWVRWMETHFQPGSPTLQNVSVPFKFLFQLMNPKEAAKMDWALVSENPPSMTGRGVVLVRLSARWKELGLDSVFGSFWFWVVAAAIPHYDDLPLLRAKHDLLDPHLDISAQVFLVILNAIHLRHAPPSEHREVSEGNESVDVAMLRKSLKRGVTYYLDHYLDQPLPVADPGQKTFREGELILWALSTAFDPRLYQEQVSRYDDLPGLFRAMAEDLKSLDRPADLVRLVDRILSVDDWNKRGFPLPWEASDRIRFREFMAEDLKNPEEPFSPFSRPHGLLARFLESSKDYRPAEVIRGNASGAVFDQAMRYKWGLRELRARFVRLSQIESAAASFRFAVKSHAREVQARGPATASRDMALEINRSFGPVLSLGLNDTAPAWGPYIQHNADLFELDPSGFQKGLFLRGGDSVVPLGKNAALRLTQQLWLSDNTFDLDKALLAKRNGEGSVMNIVPVRTSEEIPGLAKIFSLGKPALIVIEPHLRGRVEERYALPMRAKAKELFHIQVMEAPEGFFDRQDLTLITWRLSRLESLLTAYLNDTNLNKTDLSINLLVPSGVDVDWSALEERSPLLRARVVVMDLLNNLLTTKSLERVDFEKIRNLAFALTQA